MVGTRRHYGARLLLFCVLGANSACGPGDAALQTIRDRGFIRAGYAEEPPYAYLDSTGDVAGEASVALRGILPELGVDSIRWIRFDFEDLIPELRAGRIDVIAAGLFATEARAQRVAFTQPTVCARPTLLTTAELPSPGGLDQFLTSIDGRLVVLDGSVEYEAAVALGIPADRVVVVPDIHTGVAAVRRGAGRALAITLPSARRVADGNEGLEWHFYEPPAAVAGLVRGCSALAVRSTDTALLGVLNRGLERFVGSRAHLSALELLGFEGTDLPGGVAGSDQ